MRNIFLMPKPKNTCLIYYSFKYLCFSYSDRIATDLGQNGGHSMISLPQNIA